MGGGGNGGDDTQSIAATSGTSATGGGGGGGDGRTSGTAYQGGAGGSGIVVVRYRTGTEVITKCSGGLVQKHTTGPMPIKQHIYSEVLDSL